MATRRHAAEWAAGGRRRRHLRLPKFTRKRNGMLRRRGPDQKNTSAPSGALEINASAPRRLTQPAASADPRGHSKTHEASSRPPHDTPRLYTFYVVANFQQIIQTFHQFVDVCWPAVDFKRRDVAARAFRTFRSRPSFAYLLDGSPRATRHFNWSIYIPAARPKCSSFGLCRRINGVANSIILLSLLQQKSP